VANLVCAQNLFKRKGEADFASDYNVETPLMNANRK
jgi:hypothetical protein